MTAPNTWVSAGNLSPRQNQSEPVFLSAFREFDVQGATDLRTSLTQIEVQGQGAEPVWSTQLSPDSACSEGSAGSVEQQPDAGQRTRSNPPCLLC